MYNKRTWLNKSDSPSTGSVVAFEGESLWKGKKVNNTFLSVSDCFVSAKLVKTEDDTINDFIDKMKLLKNEISDFIKYLENNNGIQNSKK
jgi:hypothetical protein